MALDIIYLLLEPGPRLPCVVMPDQTMQNEFSTTVLGYQLRF